MGRIKQIASIFNVTTDYLLNNKIDNDVLNVKSKTNKIKNSLLKFKNLSVKTKIAILCRFGQRQEYTRLSPFYGSMPHTALWEAASSSRRSAAFLLP